MALDLFATHEVTVQFATADGKPMADAEVKVYAPGDSAHVVKTGKTDKNGKFEFGTDRDGLWTAEARLGGDIARATIRVGSGSGAARTRGRCRHTGCSARSALFWCSPCAFGFCVPETAAAVFEAKISAGADHARRPFSLAALLRRFGAAAYGALEAACAGRRPGVGAGCLRSKEFG